MAARRKSVSSSEQEDRLHPSVSSGSVHGDVVRRRVPYPLPTQKGLFSYMGGLSAGLICSCVLFLLTLWLPSFVRHVTSTSDKVVIQLPLTNQAGPITISDVHTKWLTEASTTLSVRIPLRYLVWLPNIKDAQSVCSTWGRYVAKDQITAFTANSEEHDQMRICVAVTLVAEAKISALQMLKHVCEKPKLLQSTNWFFLFNASQSYPVVKNLERLASTLDSATLSYIGQPVAYSTGHRICMGNKGVLLTSKAVTSICPALDWCSSTFAGSTANSFIALGLCLYESLQLSCTSSTGQYLLGSELLKSPPMSPLPDNTLIIYQPRLIDEASFLLFHQKALWLHLESMNTIEELTIAELAILKEKMPQLEYMIRLGASASSHLHSLSNNQVVEWDLIDFDSVYSGRLSEPVKPLHGMALVEINQIKDKVKLFMHHLSVSESVHNTRVDTVHRHLDVKGGVEYIVTVEVTPNAQDSKDSLTEARRKYQVRVVRPLQLAQLTGAMSSDDANSNATVYMLLFLDGNDAESELTSFLTKNAQLLEACENTQVMVATPKPEQIVSLQNVSSRLLLHNKVSFLKRNSLPMVECLAAFVQELNLECIILVTTWQMTLPPSLVRHCQALSVVSHQLYMPIAFSKFNNSPNENASEWEGYWTPDQYKVFCGWVQDMRNIFTSADSIPQHFTMKDFFHELLFQGVHIVRMAEEGLYSIASDDVTAVNWQQSHLISEIMN